jgi:hypothetical protein
MRNLLIAAMTWWFRVGRLLGEELLVASAEEARSPTPTRAANVTTNESVLARLM